MLLEVSLRGPIPNLFPGGPQTPAGTLIEGPPGTTVRYDGQMQFRSVDVAPLLEFVGQFGAGVTSTVVAEWIVGKFRGRAAKITINRREVNLDDEGQIRRVLDEVIEVER
jgi:hypothetical protein